jgi:acid stress-induced BolA-like protein IbaG/YrbA
MLNNQELEQQLKELDGIHYVKVDGDGYHYQLTLVTDVFIGKTKVARQQWVYSQLKQYIVSGQLHALSMKTWTVKEWGEHHG